MRFMVSEVMVELHDFVHGDGLQDSSYVPLNSPLRLRFQYSVSHTVEKPKWALTFVADIADKRRVVELLPPMNVKNELMHEPYKTYDGVPPLSPGERYVAEFQIETMNLTGVERKYLEHVGALQLVLMSDTKRVSELTVVVQVKRNDSGELMRRVLSPMV